MKWLLAIAFLGGLLLSGSDGPWFPWANMAGATLIAAVGVAANQMGGGHGYND